MLILLLLCIGTTDITNSYAITHQLTGSGLGLSEGNYGTSLTVSSDLSLSALCYGSDSSYPNGVPGTIYVHQTYGTGVQTTNTSKRGYKRVDGWYEGKHESLVFNFTKEVDARSVTLWLNRIHYHKTQPVWIDIWVKPSLGSAFSISNVVAFFHSTGGDPDWYHKQPDPEVRGTLSGYFNFSEFPQLSGIGSLERIIIRARREGHFFVNRFDYQLFMDNDNDGYPADVDCNDSNPNIHPGATERCNGVDDNCDGDIDESCPLYYRDVDGDGYGNPGDTTTIPEPGYVTNSNDCNDSNASIYPGATEQCNGVDDDCDSMIDEGCTLRYQDADGDGYGDPSDSTTNHTLPGYVANGGDCNDSNASVNPRAMEICNGDDDNCDTSIDEGCRTYYRDADSDGCGNPAVSQVATAPPPGYVDNSGDCNDSSASVYPGATEQCNGVDDNCIGGIDEGCNTYYQDADGDSYGNRAVSQVATVPPPGYVANYDDCDDSDSTVYLGAPEGCDGKDNDCDGSTDEGCPIITYYRDADGDGYGNPAVSQAGTTQPPGYVPNSGDCNDSNISIYPGATEQCNGVDDDCDSMIDEGCTLRYRDADGDGYGDPSDSTTNHTLTGYVANGGDCNDSNASVNPRAMEICNGVDDNCIGGVDEGCSMYYRDDDSDGYGNPAVYTTAPAQGYVANSGDCNDTDDAIHPGVTEQCNGVDEDCDGAIDEGCVPYYEDADGDGYGNAAVYVMSPAPPPGYVANAGDCNDINSNIHPGAPELCNNLKDDDCDGTMNEGCYYSAEVGGVFVPVDKFTLIAPWISLIAFITAFVVSLVVWRKRRSV